MRRWALLAVLPALLLAPAVARADETCDSALVDGAGVLGSRSADVESAAQALVAQGADVRVRTVTTADGPLDDYERRLESECRWRGPDGERKNNLIVVMVAVSDRHTGTYFGSQWDAALQTQWPRVQAQVMNPRFKEGDFAGGLSAGLAELARLIESPPPRAGQAPPPRGGAQPVAVDEPQTVPGSLPGRSALVGVTVLLAALLLAAGGYAGFTSVRRRRAARDKATEAREAAAQSFVALDELWTSARDRADLVAPALGRDDTAELVRLRAHVEPLVGEASRVHVETADAFDIGGRQAVAAYEKAAGAFTAARAAVEAAAAAAQELDTFARRLVELRTQLPTSIEASGSAIAAALTLEEQTRAGGYRTGEAQSRIAECEQHVVRARDALAAGELTSAKESLDSAADLLERTTHRMRDLPRLRSSLEATLEMLDSRVASTDAAIDGARLVFDEMSRSYSESSWQSVAGNGSEAEKRAGACGRELEECRSDLTMEHQRWDDAQAGLAQVERWLDEIASLLSAIHDLRDGLAKAQADAPLEISDARADVERARSFLTEHDADVSDELESQLAEAGSRLEAAAAELRKDKPDFLEVVASARAANELADRILEQARSEHEAMERLRQQATSARRDAESAVARASRFVQVHRRDVGKDARSLLARAMREWDDVEAAPDLETQIAEAREAQRCADEAYEHARRDFGEAERKRSDTGAALIGAALVGSAIGGHRTDSTSFGSWGSSGGGGGSSGFGSSGGGSSGGGGSTGW